MIRPAIASAQAQPTLAARLTYSDAPCKLQRFANQLQSSLVLGAVYRQASIYVTQ
jgi:hypothetical protein